MKRIEIVRGRRRSMTRSATVGIDFLFRGNREKTEVNEPLRWNDFSLKRI